MSFVTPPTHSIANACLSTCLTSTVSMIRIVGTPSASRPSAILPYMPCRCHRTRSHETDSASRCRWRMIEVERPVNSRKSAGERRV